MLLQNTARGLYCPAGDFYIDPWQPVNRAVITHGHSDHARPGSRHYLTVDCGKAILQSRLGPEATIETRRYGETVTHGGVRLSLHPAGHVLGSAQVRLECAGEVWVVSGDYKVESDRTCAPFEPVRCHTFITESTFALPIYHWRPAAGVFQQINEWWSANQEAQRTSVLFCYSLGKAQRLLAGVDAGLGPIFLHGATERFLPAYREAGVSLPNTLRAETAQIKKADGRGLVLAPASAANSPWLRKFGDVSLAFASGWMQIRGPRRRRALDRGFVLSDHADWDGLQQTIRATGAQNIWVTHGYAVPFARYLREAGWQADAIETRFQGEFAEEGEQGVDLAPAVENTTNKVPGPTELPEA
jgi:putative mRNA 3-end processing factor